MLTVTRDVFYCEHCKRHRLSARAIEQHEPRCIYNPGRTRCGWHGNAAFTPPPAHVAAGLLRPKLAAGEDALGWLREQMDDCPACMLAAVVQARLDWGERDDLGFDYKAEVARFREAERLQEQHAWW